MKFCTKCGNQLNGEKFCPKCGAPTGAQMQQQSTGGYTPTPPAGAAQQSTKGYTPQQPTYTPPQPNGYNPEYDSHYNGTPKKGKGKLILIIILAVVIIAAGVFAALVATKTIDLGAIFNSEENIDSEITDSETNDVESEDGETVTSGKSYEDVTDEFFNALFSYDAEAIVALLPEGIVDKAIETEYNGNRDEFVADFQEIFETGAGGINDELEAYGVTLSDFDITHTITSTEDWDSERVEEAIKTINDQYGGIDSDIEEGKDINVEVTVSLSGLGSQSMQMDISVVKIGNSWYLTDIMGSGLLSE